MPLGNTASCESPFVGIVLPKGNASEGRCSHASQGLDGESPRHLRADRSLGWRWPALGSVVGFGQLPFRRPRAWGGEAAFTAVPPRAWTPLDRAARLQSAIITKGGGRNSGRGTHDQRNDATVRIPMRSEGVPRRNGGAARDVAGCRPTSRGRPCGFSGGPAARIGRRRSACRPTVSTAMSELERRGLIVFQRQGANDPRLARVG
jgi:hypothetical protein